MKADTYDGSIPWLDLLKSHFDAVARINEWSQGDKGLYLAVSLRKNAQTVCTPKPDRVQLIKRKQKSIESLSALGQSIRWLVHWPIRQYHPMYGTR